VWLHEDQLSHYDYWQFWRNTDDRDVGRFLRLFTDVPLDEIARLEALEGAEINDAKRQLADAATALCRGVDAAAIAAETARQTFEIGALSQNLPTVAVPEAGILLIDALAALGFAASNKEARRKIEEGAVRVDGEQVRDPRYRLVVPQGTELPLSLGSKRHGRAVSSASLGEDS